jgi:hypothetical protein
MDMGPQLLIAEDETQRREWRAQALEHRNLRDPAKAV